MVGFDHSQTGKPQTVTDPNGVVTSYSYDSLDRVKTVTIAGDTTAYSYTLSGKIASITLPKGNAVAYTYDSLDRLSQIKDALGSVVAITDSTGSLVQRYEYDAYGAITYVLDPTFKQPYGFTGREYDEESGLYYYRARYYDPRTGRFLSKDPIGFAGGDVNLYGYVLNDPVNWVDPWGLELINNSPNPVLVKPENGSPTWVPANSPYGGDVDGVKIGDRWYKVLDGVDVTVNPDGTPTKSGGPAKHIPDMPDLGWPTDKAPGWKDEPGFSDRNPNWKYDPNEEAC